MNARKGFVFSLLAISFMMLLVFMATTMAKEHLESERVVVAPVPNSFASASLDNIGGLVADFLLPSASITNNANGTMISVSDTLPRRMDASQLYGLKYYAEGQLANSQHATINMNITQVENGSLDVRMMDNFVFQSTMNSSSMLFRSLVNESSTNATSYIVTIFVNDYRNSSSDFSYVQGGAVNVTVRYTDWNGTRETSGSLNSDVENHLVIEYSTGKADIVIGRVEQNGSCYYDALQMNITNEIAAYSFSAQLPPQLPGSSSLIVFPVQMVYAQGGVRKTANVST